MRPKGTVLGTKEWEIGVEDLKLDRSEQSIPKKFVMAYKSQNHYFQTLVQLRFYNLQGCPPQTVIVCYHLISI
jgi:hypothetical protein